MRFLWKVNFRKFAVLLDILDFQKYINLYNYIYICMHMNI